MEDRLAKVPPCLRGAVRIDARARDDRVRNDEGQALCDHRPDNARDASCVVVLLPTERESDRSHRWFRARNCVGVRLQAAGGVHPMRKLQTILPCFLRRTHCEGASTVPYEYRRWRFEGTHLRLPVASYCRGRHGIPSGRTSPRVFPMSTR